jgi:hypothetical protein
MTDDDAPKFMQAIVIGGAANGMVIERMRVDAEIIELSRPEYIKPLAYSKQYTPDVKYECDKYHVCTIWLGAGGPAMVPFGLVIVEGMTVVQAYSELVKGFARNAIHEQSAKELQT